MNEDTYDTLADAFQSFLDDHAKGQGFSENTNSLWNDYLTRKAAELVYEDHQKQMTSSEMTTHLKRLFKMCENKEAEQKFLSKLGNAVGKKDCTEKDLKECARQLCNKDAEQCDKTIHALEKQVGYESNNSKEELKEDWSMKGRGTVVVDKESGKKGVILSTDGGDANVAPVVGSSARFRSPSLWRKGTYSATGEKMKVPDSAPGGKKNKGADSPEED